MRQADAEPLDAWLALVNAPGIGPRTVSKLLAHFGSPTAVLQASAERLTAAGAIRISTCLLYTSRRG